MKTFVDIFIKKKNTKNLVNSMTTDLNNVYDNMLYYNKEYIDISYFINNFIKKHDNFKDNYQQDSQEFIRVY